MPIVAALLAGLVFGLGLIASGMTNPAKVIGFLDLAGRWDPSLALVMGGAIAAGLPAFAVARRRRTSLLGRPMPAAPSRTIDLRLVGGSALFGIGWGIGGFCPGPGVVAIGMGQAKALVFVAAMLAGMGVFQFIESRRRSAAASDD